MQLITGIRTAGKQQAIEVFQRTQRLPCFTSALHQIQHARRQPRLLPQFYYCFTGPRRQLAGFENQRIACQQCRNNMTIG